jgi:hypothetical protein
MDPEEEDLRLDVKTLRAMIDRLLDEGVRAESPILRAAVQVLADRRRRLDELEEQARRPSTSS